MIKALNNDWFLTDIKDAASDQLYFCPECRQKLMQRKGTLRIPHFAHFGLREPGAVPCSYNGTGEKTEWHLFMQRLFPTENYEVCVKHGDERRVADVKVGDIVVEFQHSSISLSEFIKRNLFYRSFGIRICWVFDCIEEYSDERITQNIEEDGYDWGLPRYPFRNLSFTDDEILVFMQFRNPESMDDPVLERMTRIRDSGQRVFTDRKNVLSLSEFVRLVSDGTLFDITDKDREKTGAAKNGDGTVPVNAAAPAHSEYVRPLKETGTNLYDLWDRSYQFMIAEKSDGSECFVIFSDGRHRMETDDFGRIMGKYTHRKYNGTFYYSRHTYRVKDALAPVWTLVNARENPNHHLSGHTLDELIEGISAGESVIVRCNKDARAFVVVKAQNGRLDFGRLDLETGEYCPDPALQKYIWPRRKHHIWHEVI